MTSSYPHILRCSRAAQVGACFALAAGGILVQVPESEAENAKALLASGE